MPVFNAGMFVSEAIDSIRRQSFQNWEMIVINDGSTDDSWELVVSRAAEDSRIRVIDLKHSGITACLNRGLQEAKADLIARMDADDIAHPERLEKQFEFLSTHTGVGVISSQVEVFPKDCGEGLQVYADWTNWLISSESIFAQRFVDAPVVHPSVCFRKSVIDQYGGYRDGPFPEDYELWLRWMAEGVIFEKLPEVLLQWRDHGSKLTRTCPRYSEGSIWALKGRYFDRWFENQNWNDREIYIWGAGRKSRSRLRYFKSVADIGVVDAFIDINPKKIDQRISGIQVVDPSHVASVNPKPFVIVMVGSRGARALISDFLNQHGFAEVRDFLFLA